MLSPLSTPLRSSDRSLRRLYHLTCLRRLALCTSSACRRSQSCRRSSTRTVSPQSKSAMPPPVDISANEASSADPLGNLTGGAPGLGGVSSPGLDAAMLGAGAAGGSGPTPLPGMPGGQEIHFAPGIEEEANSYFQRIYTGASSIDEVIALLKRFQASSKPREQQVYACMVHNLFDEYRYFPKYPDKPLRTTALLFGALVQHSLVSHITLGMFLRYVLEALRKPPGSKMCKFGVAALESFRDRLPEWPQYCQHLYAVPHFSQVLPELIPLLESVPGIRSGAAATTASGGAPPSAPPGLFSGGLAGLGADDPSALASGASPVLPGGAAARPAAGAAATGAPEGFTLLTRFGARLGSSGRAGFRGAAAAAATATAIAAGAAALTAPAATAAATTAAATAGAGGGRRACSAAFAADPCSCTNSGGGADDICLRLPRLLDRSRGAINCSGGGRRSPRCDPGQDRLHPQQHAVVECCRAGREPQGDPTRGPRLRAVVCAVFGRQARLARAQFPFALWGDGDRAQHEELKQGHPNVDVTECARPISLAEDPIVVVTALLAQEPRLVVGSSHLGAQPGAPHARHRHEGINLRCVRARPPHRRRPIRRQGPRRVLLVPRLHATQPVGHGPPLPTPRALLGTRPEAQPQVRDRGAREDAQGRARRHTAVGAARNPRAGPHADVRLCKPRGRCRRRIGWCRLWWWPRR